MDWDGSATIRLGENILEKKKKMGFKYSMRGEKSSAMGSNKKTEKGKL